MVSGAMPSFSIIIPTYNEAANIRRCLRSIRDARQAAEPVSLDIHVIDNRSTDGAVSGINEYGVKTHVMTHRVSIARLRNYGARMSQGSLLLFLDADMEVSSNWLQTIRNYFVDNRADALGFLERVPSPAPWSARVWCERVLASRPKVREVDYLAGRNLTCRRDLFEKVGGFDASLVTAEDKDFVLRLKREGARVVSDPNVRIVHWGYERGLAELARKEFWRQSNNLSLIQRHGLSWRLLRFPVMSLAHACLGAIVIATILNGELTKASLAIMVWFAPSLLSTLFRRFNRRSWLFALQLVFLNWLRYNVAGFAVICELIRQLKTLRLTQRAA